MADWTTIASLGARPVAVITSITAQGKSVFRSSAVTPALLRAQLQSILERHKIAAVKFGMIPNGKVLRAAVEMLPNNVPWVVDPVVRTSRGELLSTLQARDFLRLAKTHVILTPNRLELRWLARAARHGLGDYERGAKRLGEQGYLAVIVKGGHASRKAVDVVVSDGKLRRLSGSRIRRGLQSHRGTGCRFASALAVGLAQGLTIWAASAKAKAYVRGYLRSRSLEKFGHQDV